MTDFKPHADTPDERALADAQMRALMDALQDIMPGLSITLIIADFGAGGGLNYISNSAPEDMRNVLTEMIERIDARTGRPIDG